MLTHLFDNEGKLYVELQLKDEFKVIHLPFDQRVYSIMKEKYKNRFTFNFDLTFFKPEGGYLYGEISKMYDEIQ